MIIVRTLTAPIFILISTCLFTYSVNADDKPLLKNILSSTLHPFSNITIIDRESIEMSSAMTLTELLRGQSGIQISDHNAGAVFSLRGFNSAQAANNTLIIIDGRRLNNNDIAAPILNAINVEQVQRVEILSGSAGVLYGDQAVAGIINIITKTADIADDAVGFSVGNLGHYQARLHFGHQNDSGWGYYVSSHYDESDGYRNHNGRTNSSALGRLNYHSQDTELTVELAHYDSRIDVPGSLNLEQFKQDPKQSNPIHSEDYLHDMSTAYRFSLNHQWRENWRFDLDMDFTDTTVNAINWGSGSTHQRTRFAISPKAIFTKKISEGELSIVKGLDISRNTAKYSWGRDNKQTITAGYIEAFISLAKPIKLSVGGRYSKLKEDLTDLITYPNEQSLDQTASAWGTGIHYQLKGNQQLYLKAEQNFRFAKIDEQAYTSPGVVGLKPQTGRSFELGWRYDDSNHQLNIDLYRLDLVDEIVWDPNATKPLGSKFEGANINADSSKRLGLGVDWEWQFTQQLMFGAEYDFVDAKYTRGSYRTQSISGVSKHTARVHFDVEISNDWYFFGNYSA